MLIEASKEMLDAMANRERVKYMLTCFNPEDPRSLDQFNREFKNLVSKVADTNDIKYIPTGFISFGMTALSFLVRDTNISICLDETVRSLGYMVDNATGLIIASVNSFGPGKAMIMPYTLHPDIRWCISESGVMLVKIRQPFRSH